MPYSKPNTDDVRILEINEVAPPAHLLREFPASDPAAQTTFGGRQAVHRVLHGADDRLVMVIGPCSIHDVGDAREYARRLNEAAPRFEKDLLIVMRVYFEKPRTTVGWKGLINDPRLDHSYRINEGLRLARSLLLEINATVLCGDDARRRAEYAQHLAASESRFYGDGEGSAKQLLDWYAAHRDESTWKRAAGVYVRILSEPQLFIEGNHRSGSLIVSYLQLRDGFPPFVLSLDNAEAYFNPSTVIRRQPKSGVAALFKLPRIKKRYARFLEEQAHGARAARYVRAGDGGNGGGEPAPPPAFAPLASAGSAR